MIQNRLEVLQMVAAGTVNPRDGVQLLQKLKPQSAANDPHQPPSQADSAAIPKHTLSAEHLPWFFMQIPIQNL
ncbi:MAG: hypothetical protein ACI9EW_000522 [Cellvibrionaceae bacterium]|jgi:hypothetical protein